MAGEAALAGLSYDAYLALERDTGQRYEWLDGQVYAMAGGTLTHAALSAAVLAELRALTLGRGCVVFSSDAKVRVEAGAVDVPRRVGGVRPRPRRAPATATP
jgi:Uma2 family endonuclease